MKSTNSVLFLSSVMKMGHGVSVVLHQLKSDLEELGWDIEIATLEKDDSEIGKSSYEIFADIASVTSLANELQANTLVAVTTPFFEMLPVLSEQFKTVAYEMGDPTPSLFVRDSRERMLIVENKLNHVYPKVDEVITISNFLVSDIKWEKSKPIHLGCDHVQDFGTKGLQDFRVGENAKLAVGTLMRLGEGEANYKGLDEFFRLKEVLGSSSIDFHIMGRGNLSDKEKWENKGFIVHLNATDNERAHFLRYLDVFVSPSLWEGFNLPLVEAQASGTVAVAFDVGAHPEVTPFLFRSVDEMARQITYWSRNFDSLRKDSSASYHFARSKFNWKNTAAEFSDSLKKVNGLAVIDRSANSIRRNVRLKRKDPLKALTMCVRDHGYLYTGNLILKYARSYLKRQSVAFIQFCRQKYKGKIL